MPTTIDFPPPSQWSTGRGATEGLAHGWLGWAWAWLQLREAGLVPDDAPLRRALLSRLSRLARFRPARAEVSQFNGSGAAPLVAALASRFDREFLSLIRPLIKRWRRSYQGCRETDFMAGSAGALVACCGIQSRLPGWIPADFLRELVQDCESDLRELIASHRREPVTLGLAHGLAGRLLAMEMSAAHFGQRLSAGLRSASLEKLEQESHSLRGKAAAWPVLSGQKSISIHGWCHGGPGIGLGLLCAHALTDLPEYAQLATLALEGTYLLRNESRSFCCGSIGRAQILIEAFRLSGDRRWLRKARILSRPLRPAWMGRSERGFHKGRLGELYLDWRLTYPEHLPLMGLESLAGRAARLK